MTNPQLKPCPFCGEEPEIDTRQAYRALGDGRIGDAVAIYCAGCAAQHSICLRDVPEMSREDCLAHVTELWNRRPPVEPGDRNITTVGGIERFPVLQSGLMDTAPDVLKPCPFCGHEAAFKDSGVKGHDHFCVRVCCSNGSCGVCTPEHYKTREAAAMAWNRRSVNREAGQ